MVNAGKLAHSVAGMAGQAVISVGVYDHITGKIMTAHALNAWTPAIAKTTMVDFTIKKAAEIIYFFPKAALGGLIVTSFITYPNKMIEAVENFANMVFKSAEALVSTVECGLELLEASLLLTSEAASGMANNFPNISDLIYGEELCINLSGETDSTIA